MWGISKQDIIISRICRTTYGACYGREFEFGDPLGYNKWADDDGEAKCRDASCVFVRIGDAILVHYTVTEVFTPCVHFQMHY